MQFLNHVDDAYHIEDVDNDCHDNWTGLETETFEVMDSWMSNTKITPNKKLRTFQLMRRERFRVHDLLRRKES